MTASTPATAAPHRQTVITRFERIGGRAFLLVALWTVPVILGSAGHYFGLVAGGGGMPASHIIGHSVALWYVWIPATPAIVALLRLLSFTMRRLPVLLGAHTLVLLAVFALQSWLTVTIGHLTGHVRPDVTFGRNLTFAVVNLLLYDMLVYGGIVAVACGIEYARRYRDRDLRASQLETQLERARLEMLRLQLQPHFLFNALNAIAMLVRRDRREEAVDVVVGFSELLRYVLNESGTVDVTLDDELRFVHRYLEIEGVRLGDRLSTHVEIQPGIGHALLPNLLLQPLVENALKHGVVVRPGGGTVWIRAERHGDALRLLVEDDGPGLAASVRIAEDGVGLRNLRERLEVFFGADASFTIDSRAGGGTCAVVTVPFRTAARAAHAAGEKPLAAVSA